ncbi:MAG: hypothetical protein ABR601_03105 [Parasphingopyxis sp.]|nr:hypothetical protein [Sphingomonadales bacterium]
MRAGGSAYLIALTAAMALVPAALAQSAPALPPLPATPVIADTPYPDCRDDYQSIEDTYEKAERTTQCVAELDGWHAGVLVPHRQAMLDHQQAIADIYEAEVQNNFGYSQAQRDEFFASVTAEHEASNLDGEHLAAYREALARYEADRAWLGERFCRYAGNCPGWTPTAETAARDAADARVAPTFAPGEQSASTRGGRGNNDCGTERTGGGLLGGILGGVVGEATGLGALAGAIIGQAAGVLVADIACQLEPEEQEKAVEATEEVLAQEEVGATAEWTSPTRADVSGSSTVTALNSQPNGATCLDITDVAIIAGEETRVSKTMCRQPGESRYTLQA